MDAAQLALERVLLFAGRLDDHWRAVALLDALAEAAQRSFELLLVALQTLQGARLLVHQLVELVELLHLGLDVRLKAILN